MLSERIPDGELAKGGRTVLITSLIAVVVVLMGFLMNGFILFEASSTCKTTFNRCHGIPTGNTCLGFRTAETVIEEKSSCDRVDAIEKRCGELGEKYCDATNDSIGEAWSNQALVFGQTCEAWSNAYGIDLRSC